MSLLLLRSANCIADLAPRASFFPASLYTDILFLGPFLVHNTLFRSLGFLHSSHPVTRQLSFLLLDFPLLSC